jgi:hypothetical protein
MEEIYRKYQEMDQNLIDDLDDCDKNDPFAMFEFYVNDISK